MFQRVSQIMWLLFCGVQRHCSNWYRFEPYIIVVNAVQFRTIQNYRAHVYECLYQFLPFSGSRSARVRVSLRMYERTSKRAITRTVYHFIGSVRVFPTRLFSHALFTLNWPLLKYSRTHSHCSFHCRQFSIFIFTSRWMFFPRFFSKLLWFAWIFSPSSFTFSLQLYLSLSSIGTSVM